MGAQVDSPFLRGNFAPVQDELTVTNLEVEGELPKDLLGTYVRNGPNPRFVSPMGYHWFEGDGMLHGVKLTSGGATYLNRYVQTEALREETEAGKALWSAGFRPGHREPIKNAANTSVVQIGRKSLALLEGGKPYAFDETDLSTLGEHDFEGRLKGTFTAHPKLDPGTGELVYFGWHPLRKRVDYGVVDAKGELVHQTHFELPVTTLMHDFAITEHYAVFFDVPLKYRLEKLAQGKVPVSWEPEHGTRVGVLPRRGEGAEVRWYTLPPFYFYHLANAYEEGGELEFVVARQAYTTFAGAIEKPTSGTSSLPRLHSFRLKLSTGECSETALDREASEFPRVSPKVVGRPYRYTYGAHAAAETGIRSVMSRGAFKLDHVLGTISEHRWGEGCFGGENVFVPRADATTEDDGYLLGFVYDAQADTSSLRILNAQDLARGEVARVRLPRRVPFGFHGEFLPSSTR